MRFRNQKGFTMIEMLVALLIAGIFFTIFASVVLATFETLRSGDERTVAQQNARVGLNYIANDIRHATEIVPLRLEEYRDWAGGGFPVFDDALDPADETGGTDAWPIYRRSTDSDPEGFIDLSMDGAPGDGDEYDQFRDDGFPYDIRPLAPNRISLLFQGSSYYPNTEYYVNFLAPPVDLDGIAGSNAQAASTRVTYEHQLVEPRHPEIYENGFSGREKQFNMVVNRLSVESEAVEDVSEFVIVRSFQMENPTVARPDTGQTDQPPLGPLVADTGSRLTMDEPYLRQPVADHVINLRFRYWYINGSDMIEIRYDPDNDNMGGDSVNCDDGYFRYFDIYGNEIYTWYNHRSGDMVPLVETNEIHDQFGKVIGYTYDVNQIYADVPDYSFVINGGPDSDDEYYRGIMLFEGWRFVNAVSINVKTANNQTLQIYKSSINVAVTSPTGAFYDFDHPDYGMGFIDFGLGDEFDDPTHNQPNLNYYDPFYQAADNLRVSTAPVNGVALFDFVEPNMNPNYNASAFTSLQTIVTPPALVEKSRAAVEEIDIGRGFWFLRPMS